MMIFSRVTAVKNNIRTVQLTFCILIDKSFCTNLMIVPK